jgi:hypothetical protein
MGTGFNVFRIGECFSSARRIERMRGEMMPRGLGWLLTFIFLAATGWWLYSHVSHRPVLGNGDVFSHNEASDSKETDESAAKSEPAPVSVAIPSAITNSTPPVAAPQQTTEQPSAVPPTTSAPASDSISPNPVNGMAFGGSGRYQWFRQGNLTWRIDTTDGTTCIDFATLEEWKKPIVSSHGCRSYRRS